MIDKTVVFNSIPSGSGMAIHNNLAYIVGDDATVLYQLDLATFKVDRVPISGMDSGTFREPRAEKRDFEALTLIHWQGKDYLLGLGSGTAPRRQRALLCDLANPADNRMLPLEDFYRHLQVSCGIAPRDWNVEGLCEADGKMFLFNRGTNSVITFPSRDFFGWLFLQRGLPRAAHHGLALPAIGTHEARISGACVLDSTALLLCASVEATNDWINDGEILGSYIGVYSLQDATVASWHQLQEEGRAVLQKIESLDVISREPGGELVIAAIGDNDNGSTTFLQIRLRP